MSKEIDLNLTQNLSSLGFTDKEAKVYILLLEGGETSAIQLSRLAELHRQFVYNALFTLKNKGLVLQIGEKRSKWRAVSPRKLIALAEEQQLKAEKTSEALLALKEANAGQEFEVTEGKSAFRSRLITNIKKVPRDATILMICGEWGRYFEHAGEQVHAEWDKIRISKNIRFRIIGPESLKQSLTQASAERSLIEYRTLPGLEKNLVNTVIYPDTVDFEIYGDPHVTFSIKNSDVAVSQKYFFDSLWQMEKKRTP